MEITTRLEFDSGHRIPNHNSQCRNLHGHRYVIEITLNGDIVQNEQTSEDGMV
ncbi:MAG: 6-carboxytetrahydropterin synthase, partial [Methylophilaceae bacterium]|nr:6-carboxytetrahydropterin synthase [Methylophilaceae bacterium]